MLDDPELLDEFVEEAREHLERIESILSNIDLRESLSSVEPINEVFRGMHSIKGAAGLLELPNIRDVSHAAESVLAAVRSGSHEITPSTVEALLRARDRLSEMVDDLSNEGAVDASQELTALEALLGPVEARDTAHRPPRKPAVAAKARPNSARDPAGSNGETVRVPLSVLDKLMALAGELVLVRNRARQDFDEKMRRDRGMATGSNRRILQQLDLVTTEIQEAVLRTRMQPIQKIFSKIPKLCRDLGDKLDKQIIPQSIGDEVEVDKTILECLADPLLHLIRNACDHGLERAEERTGAGKSAAGTLTVEAKHDAGQLLITIADDGRGVNTEKVAEKAIAQGIRRPDEIASMSEKQICGLIFAPGFSTAEAVTDVSGRGVGMDVVRTSIEGIGGSVDVYSRKGEGTTFTLRVPLSLAIVSSLIVRSNGETFSIPQVNLEEIVRLHRDEGNGTVEFVDEQPVVRVRGNLLPVVHLGDALEHHDFIPEDVLQRRAATSKEVDALTIAIVRVAEARFGLIVDEAVGSEEIVVKPNHPSLGEQRCFVGSTILGDGSVALILDVNGISEHAMLQHRFFEATPLADRTTVSVEPTQELLFTVDGRDRFLVGLSLVRRVVPIRRSQLKTTAGVVTVDLPERTLRVVMLDRYFDSKSYLTDTEDLLLILPRGISRPIGFLASKILDVVVLEREISPDLHRGPHVLGSTMLDGEVALVLDVVGLARAEESRCFHTPSPPPESRKRLLLADDTPLVRNSLSRYLEDIGYHVDVLDDGAEALERLLNEDCHYVGLVSDLALPNLDGFALIEQVRRCSDLPRLQHLPALAVSAVPSPEGRRRALAAGFDRYEHKLDRARVEQSLVELIASAEVDAA